MENGFHHDRASGTAASLDALMRGLNGRLRFLVACRGVAWTLAVLILFAMLVCTGDWYFRIDQPWLRAALALSIIACSAGLVLRFVLLPLLRHYNHVDLALEIERLRPEWRDVLASSVEFSASDCSACQGAPALQRMSVARTLARWSASDRRSIVNWRPCRRAVGSAALACLLALTAVASDRTRARVALQRLWSPYACPEWPQRHDLALLDSNFEPLADPGHPLHFAAGAPVTLYVDDLTAELPDDVTLHIARRGGQLRAIPLNRVSLADAAGRPRNVCVAILPSDSQNHALRVTGGDDASMPWYTITFSPLPDIRELQLSLRPPQYLGLAEQTVDADHGSRDVFVGTHLRLAATANVPLQSAVFRRDGRPPQDLALTPDGLRFSVEFDVTGPERFSYWFDLTDRHGLRSDHPRRSELRGVEDAAPVVTIERPVADLTATPSAEIPLRIVARDDVEVTRTSLHLSDPPGSVGERSLPLSVLPSSHVEVDATLAIADLALAAGRQLTLRAEAEDAYDLGPRHVGRSASRLLTIVTPEEKRQELLARQTGLVQGLERASGLQSRSLQQTRELRLQWQAAGAFQPADLDLLKRVVHDHSRIVTELRDEERGVARRARAILEELHWNKIDDQAADQRLRRLLDEVQRLLANVCPVSEYALDRVRKLSEDRDAADATGDIKSSLDAAAAAQSDAADTLDALLVLFAEWQRQFDLNRRAGEIVSSQQQISNDTAAIGRRTLTRRMSDLNPQDLADLARLAERQTQLSGTVRRFTEDIDRMRTDASRIGQGVPDSSLRDVLEVLREPSIAEEMQRSGELIADNQIGESLRRQQDVQRSLAELEQLLRGIGAIDPETLLKQVRDAEQEFETLRQQQADSMLRTRSVDIPGPDDAARIEALQSQQRLLADEAADAALRLRRQQFHRPAGSASRAADAMQRAAELLHTETVRQSAVAQQDAIDGLVQTQRDLADLRRQLEISQSATRFDKLAAMVHSLENRQQGLRQETARLDGQQRERGSLSRSQLATLRQLAESQVQLVRDAGQMEQTVADAPVLGMALAAVVADMQVAATRLAERSVDAPTQSAQDNAVRRLHELSEVLQEARPEMPPSEGTPSAQDPEDQLVPDLTLVAQVRLIARMQADLAGRAASLTASARGMPALTPDQREQIRQLAEEQAKLTELLAGLLDLTDASRNPAIEPTP